MTYHNYNKDNKSSTESTMVYYGIENVVNIVLQFLTQSTNIVYACIDQTRPSLITDIAMLKEAFAAAKRRGVRLRYVTEITKDNLFHCKQLLTMVDELRHLDGIKGNFYLNDRAYLAPATYHEKGRPASQIIYSNTKEIVEHQMYVFDTLWTGATPAEHRIEQLEGGVVKHESLQVIADHNKASRIFNQLLRSVKREALLFLPDNKAIDKMNKLGIIDYIIKASIEKSADIKIICSLTEENSEILDRIKKDAPSIRILNSSIYSLFSMCIVDGEKMLRTEVRDLSMGINTNAKTSTNDFSNSHAFAIYSDRKLTVESFRSVFELLWNERVLNEELKLNDKLQNEFIINIAAHELRTPIQTIAGYCELLNADLDNARLFTTPIIKRTNRLQKLSNDILDVTKIESKQLKLNLERFNLSELIVQTVTDFKNHNAAIVSQSKTKDKKTKTKEQNKRELLELDYEFGQEKEEDDNNNNSSIFVEADQARITSVISNFLTNAIKFTRSGWISVKCFHEYRQQDKDDKVIGNSNYQGNVIVTVKDTDWLWNILKHFP